MKKNLLILFAGTFLAITSFGKEGMYLEFKMTSSAVTGVSKTFSTGGNTRSETSITLASFGRSMSTTVLILQNNPGKVYMLNESGKTYTESSADKAGVSDADEYQVTVIGKETVNNYASTHVKVLNTRTQKESEMWVSKDVSGFAYYTTVKNKYLGGSKLFDALKDQGADGFVVRMLVSDDHGGQLQLDLVKAEKRDIDESLFSLDGYTKGGSATPPGMPTAPSVDIDKLQKMTPEERAKYIQDLKAKYQQQGH